MADQHTWASPAPDKSYGGLSQVNHIGGNRGGCHLAAAFAQASEVESHREVSATGQPLGDAGGREQILGAGETVGLAGPHPPPQYRRADDATLQ